MKVATQSIISRENLFPEVTRYGKTMKICLENALIKYYLTVYQKLIDDWTKPSQLAEGWTWTDY